VIGFPFPREKWQVAVQLHIILREIGWSVSPYGIVHVSPHRFRRSYRARLDELGSVGKSAFSVTTTMPSCRPKSRIFKSLSWLAPRFAYMDCFYAIVLKVENSRTLLPLGFKLPFVPRCAPPPRPLKNAQCVRSP
jgi:hypothetical protein